MNLDSDADLVIRGGTIVDGTGRPGFEGDVAISDGRIVGIANRLRGRHRLEADGCVVAPGFIDIHTHSGQVVRSEPRRTGAARPT